MMLISFEETLDQDIVPNEPPELQAGVPTTATLVTVQSAGNLSHKLYTYSQSVVLDTVVKAKLCTVPGNQQSSPFAGSKET